VRELVGQGKPFYSSLDKAAGLLRRNVGTGSEFLKELMSIPGVKQAEIAERGLGELLNAPKMTHEQFLAALGSKPAPAIHEKIFNVGNTDDPQLLTAEERNNPPEGLTYHENWTLPGGKNYREMLIKAPAPKYSQDKIMEVEAKLRRAAPNMVKHYTDMLNVMKKDAGQNEQFPGVPQHFGGEPGILASMRLKDRTGPNGEKLLHLEELQSDWHQQGREKGYKEHGSEEKMKQAVSQYDQLSQLRRDLLDQAEKTPDEQMDVFTSLMDKEREVTKQLHALQENMDTMRSASRSDVPDAPFKKNWEEMALKRLIHHAAENGYHGVVVTPGAEQADRYSLAKHIDALEWDQRTGRLYAKQKNSSDFNKMADNVTEDNLSDHVGKEVAEKLMAQPSTGTNRQLNGVDLKVGGEGMKGFYDKKVPNILNSIGKKYGVKTELGGHKLPGDPSQRAEASERLGLAGERFSDMSPEQIQAFNQKLDDANAKQLHYFPITEEMRQDVKKNGIPLYESGGTVSTH